MMRWLVKIIAAIWPSSVEGLDSANAHLLAHIQHLREENDTLRSENEGLQGLIRQLQDREDRRTSRRSLPGVIEMTFTVPPVRRITSPVAEVALATSRELRSRGAPRRPRTFTGPEAEDL